MTYDQVRRKVISGKIPVNTFVRYRENINSATDELYQDFLYDRKINQWEKISIFRMSIMIEDKEMFDYLIKCDCKSAVNCDSIPIIQAAAFLDDLYYLKELLKAGVDAFNPEAMFLDLTLFVYRTNSSIFYNKDEYQLVEYFLSCGGDVSFDKTNPFASPAVKAATLGKIKVVKVLLNHMYDAGLVITGDERQESTAYDFSTLIENLGINNMRSLKLMFAHSDLDINAVDEKGRNFLYHCVFGFWRESAHLFLSAGINVNHRDEQGKLVIEIDPQKYPLEKVQLIKNIVKRYIVKFIAAGFYVCKENSKAVSGSEYQKFHQDCNKEVELLKTTKICKTKYTYYDLLHVDHHKIALRLQSVDGSVVIDQDSLEEDFPEYGRMIFYRLEKLEQRRQLLKNAFHVLHDIFKYDLPATFVYDLYYCLSNFDLIRLHK